MGVKFNNSRGVGNYPFVDNYSFKKKSCNLKSDKNSETHETKTYYTREIDISSNEILSNYARAGLNLNRHKGKREIPNGHSRYEYKGARFDIYRNDDEYKSQFVYPHGFDIDEFADEFPNLENQPIIKSKKTGNSIESINGEIDETISQSSKTGDCWLISSLVSLSQNEKGKEIIKNAITVNDNNTVTVSFKGIGVSYTLSESEISKYDTDSKTYDSYSNGDNDALVVELAVEKLWKDIQKGKVVLDTDNENITYTGEGSGIEDGGLPSQMIYYLTGIESDEYYNDDLSSFSKKEIYNILNQAYSTNSVVNIGLYYNVHSCKLSDGSTFSIDTSSGGHALAVTNITSDKVTFVNPWDTSVEYSATWEEFASLGIGYISVSDLSEAKEKEVVDVTSDETSQDYDYSRYSNFDYSGRYDRKYDRNYGFDFDYGYSSEIDEIDFDADNNEIRYDYYKDEPETSDFSYNYEKMFIMELLYEFLSIFKSLFGMLRI